MPAVAAKRLLCWLLPIGNWLPKCAEAYPWTTTRNTRLMKS